MHDVEASRRHDDVRALPTPDRGDRDDSARRHEHSAEGREWPSDEGGGCAEDRERDRAREGPDEDDAVPPRVQSHALAGASVHGFVPSPGGQKSLDMKDTARRALTATLVVGGVVILALALWKIRVLIALLFLGFIVAAAMRPGVEALKRGRVPRGIGIAAHYVGLFALFGLLLWLVVPRALEQVRKALGEAGTADLREEARNSTGLKHDILVGIQDRLEELPSASELVDPALELGLLGFEIAIGIFFVLATGAYWIFERDRAVNLVASLMPRPRRKTMRDTWTLIDLKLGAYVRG